MPNTLGTFFETKEGYTYDCVEGNITKAEGYSVLNGAPLTIIKFANPITPETFLKFSKKGDLTVEKPGASTAASGSGSSAKDAEPEYATHICEKEPEWKSGPIPCPTGASITDGNYNRRHVTAYRLTTGEMELPLSPTNSALQPGDEIVLDTDTGALDKAGSSEVETSTVTCLETIAANTGGYVLVDLREPKILTKVGT